MADFGQSLIRKTRARWNLFFGDGFPADHYLFGTGALCLDRSLVDLDLAREMCGGKIPTPEEVGYDKLQLHPEKIERAEVYWAQLLETGETGELLEITEVRNTHPTGSPSNLWMKASQFRSRMVFRESREEYAWVSGSALRNAYDLLDENIDFFRATPEGNGVLFYRAGTIVDPPRLVGALGRLAGPHYSEDWEIMT